MAQGHPFSTRLGEKQATSNPILEIRNPKERGKTKGTDSESRTSAAVSLFGVSFGFRISDFEFSLYDVQPFLGRSV